MSHNKLSSRKRQLAHLSKHIHSLSSNWNELSAEYKARLLSLLERLHGELKRFLPRAEMTRILGAAALLVGASSGQDLQAQNFAAPVSNLFGFSPTYVTIPEFADIDDDGDMDLFFNNYYYNFLTDIVFLENTGTAAIPNWGPPQSNPFGIVPGVGYTIGQELVDIDGDGDLDLFTAEYDQSSTSGRLGFRENTGTATSPQFGTLQLDPFGFVGSTDAIIVAPDLADIDGDGDYDLITMDGDSYGYFLRVWENTGTSSAASFVTVQPNPLSGLSPFASGSYLFPTLADLDWDGDLDLLIGSVGSGDLSFHENTGTSQAAVWDLNGSMNPFGIQGTIDYGMFPDVVDIDDDGDMDIVSGGYYGGLFFYENLDISIGVDESAAANISVFPNPASENLTVDLGELQDVQLQISDVHGRIVKSLSAQSGKVQLDISEFAAGVYTLSVSSNERSFSEKLLVE